MPPKSKKSNRLHVDCPSQPVVYIHDKLVCPLRPHTRNLLEPRLLVPSAVEVVASGRHGEGKPRLMIKKMVLENFKSYLGVQEIGPFHKCFSSIVGPNGSGKSNVIDALLFVFGRRVT